LEKNCKLDYTGRDVTPENFLAVLKGDAAAVKGKGTGRVLTSTKDDKVFVYFTDHGATGLIAFPSSELYADQLIKGLQYMHDKQMYKRLVFYLEACESGSMFEKVLPTNWEIYTTTASTSSESSWATYCSPNDKVNGKSIGSCLGDEYSVNWMEDTEGDTTDKILQKQFEDVKLKTKGSHVCQWGIVDWAKEEKVTNYQGDLEEMTLWEKVYGYFHKKINNYFKTSNQSTLSSPYFQKLYYLQRVNEESSSNESRHNLEKEEKLIANTDLLFSKMNERELGPIELEVLPCLRESINFFKETCHHLWGEYTLKYARNIYTACKHRSIQSIQQFFTENCHN